jgi:hypothetical protein
MSSNVGWVEPWVPFVLGPKDLGLEHLSCTLVLADPVLSRTGQCKARAGQVQGPRIKEHETQVIPPPPIVQWCRGDVFPERPRRSDNNVLQKTSPLPCCLTNICCGKHRRNLISPSVMTYSAPCKPSGTSSLAALQPNVPECQG